MLKVDQDTATGMMVALGYPNAKKWPEARLALKLSTIDQNCADEHIKELTDPKHQALFVQVMANAKATGGVDIIPTPAGGSPELNKALDVIMKPGFATPNPILTKYVKYRAENPGCLLLFLVESTGFWECYGEDARTIAPALGLPITTQSPDTPNPLAMSGFPDNRLELHLAELVAAGHRVATIRPEQPPEIHPAATLEPLVEVKMKEVEPNPLPLDGAWDPKPEDAHVEPVAGETVAKTEPKSVLDYSDLPNKPSWEREAEKEAAPEPPKRRGRPPGSKNTPAPEAIPVETVKTNPVIPYPEGNAPTTTEKRGRGRPKGSKNVPGPKPPKEPKKPSNSFVLGQILARHGLESVTEAVEAEYMKTQEVESVTLARLYLLRSRHVIRGYLAELETIKAAKENNVEN